VPAPVTVAALRSHRARQAEELLAVGVGVSDDVLVFTHVDGSALNPATVSRRFDRLVKEAKVPKITLHGTRHTWATLALPEGIPAKVVAEVLGHSSTQMTLDVDSYVTPGMQSDATSRVANLLTGGWHARRSANRDIGPCPCAAGLLGCRPAIEHRGEGPDAGVRHSDRCGVEERVDKRVVALSESRVTQNVATWCTKRCTQGSCRKSDSSAGATRFD
jgi:hypothetical protein